MDAIAEIGSAFLTIAPSLRGFGGALNAQAGGTIRSSGKSLGSAFGKAFIAGGALLAAAGIGSFLKGSIEEAREAQKVGAATGAILKATGGAANLSADQIGSMATALSAYSAVDDEVIQQGQNLLLTFKNVKNAGSGLDSIFTRATKAGLDLAAAGFGSVEGNAKQLGKALNDPLKGISALSRSGVTFTAGQQKQIKGFVAANDLLSAQKIILKEVEAQVGGTAGATATSGEKAAVAFGNIKEQVGTALLPVVDGFFNLFLSQVPRITGLINAIGPAFGKVQSFLAPFVTQVQGFLAGQGDGSISGGLAKLARIAVFFTPLGPAVGLFVNFRTEIVRFGTAARDLLLPIFQQIAAIVTGQVLPILRSLGAFFVGTLVPAVAAIAVAVGQRLKPIFDQLVATFRGSVLPALQQILAAFQRNLPTIKKIASAVVSVIGFLLKLAASILGKVIPVLIRLAGFIISKVVPALIAIASGAIRVVGGLISFGQAVGRAGQAVVAFAKKVASKIQEVVQFFKQLPSKVISALGNVGSLLKDAGSKIIQGLIDGVTAKIGALKSKLASITKLIPKLKGPPTTDKVLLYPAGRMIMDGLIDGISSREKALATKLGKVTKSMRDNVAGVVDGLKSDFASLSDSVSGNLTGSLFSGFDTAGSFLANLTTVKGNFGTALADFKTLKGFGLSPKFLSQLFADGGFPLIHSLATDQGAATAAGSLFGDIQGISGNLGNAVANLDIGPKLDQQVALLQAIDKKLGDAPKKTGDEVSKGVNGGASKGAKRGSRKSPRSVR